MIIGNVKLEYTEWWGARLNSALHSASEIAWHDWNSITAVTYIISIRIPISAGALNSADVLTCTISGTPPCRTSIVVLSVDNHVHQGSGAFKAVAVCSARA